MPDAADQRGIDFASSAMSIDTPALLVDLDLMERNLRWGQDKADKAGVKLRPHVKAHRTPALAKRQLDGGACGIAAAKLGEAETMAESGIADIFIANQIVGETKLKRLRSLSLKANVTVAVDHIRHVQMLSGAFRGAHKPLDVMIEIDTGDARTGVKPGDAAVPIAEAIYGSPCLRLKGIYTHAGRTYGASSLESVNEIFCSGQRQVLSTADVLRKAGFELTEISVGGTPSLLAGEILPGITEFRAGAYLLFDAAQAALVGNYDRCALTVLATITSTPTKDRAVVDAGAKAISSSIRGEGVCKTIGYGVLKHDPSIHLYKISDEHGLFRIPPGAGYEIGRKVEIIPNHVCPACNLYERIYAVQGGQVVHEWEVSARGRSQ